MHVNVGNSKTGTSKRIVSVNEVAINLDLALDLTNMSHNIAESEFLRNLG